jgi:uncharacterized membrane protein
LQAAYLQSLSDFEKSNGAANGNAPSSGAISIGFVVGMVFMALALLAIIVGMGKWSRSACVRTTYLTVFATAVWFFVIRRRHERHDIEVQNAAFYSARQ